jgi:MFS family permease
LSESLSVKIRKPRALSRQTLFQKILDRAIWANHNFRTFVISDFVVQFGYHFYAIALPWLVLEMTGSVEAMGIAIALSGIPRLAFMMVGGLLSDRHSPRIVILLANAIRAIILALFTWSLVAGRLDLFLLYSLSFATGVADGLTIPARGAIVPTLVDQEQLGAANLINNLQGIVWGLIGPILASVVISWLNYVSWPTWTVIQGHPGVSAAFAIDFIAILVSSLCLWRVKSNWQMVLPFREKASLIRMAQEAVSTFSTASVLSIVAVTFGSVRDLINIIWQEANLRMAFLMVYGINLISSTPLYVGMPMLAASRFPQGAQTLGFIASAISIGGLLGTVLAGLLPQPSGRQIRKYFVAVLSGTCLGLVIMVSAWSIPVAMIAVLLLASSISYVNIVGTTQIQRLTPPELMGRMMGLLNLK